MKRIALAIHGGCGVMAKLQLTDEEWAGARADLAQALRAGWRQLADGRSALDAVEAAVIVLEDSPHFNAGHGAALNAAGEHELDASIMDGRDLAAGAVCAARRIRNPVRAARAVMEHGESVLLTGPAADRFARTVGLETAEADYFTTERRREALAAMQAHARAGTSAAASEAEKHGTVGAVALDAQGHLAAATSTGGFTNKPVGRVGDSPIIGAGTYARDGACAFSGTGKGEIFIRHCIGHDLASRMLYKGESLDEAARAVLDGIAHRRVGAGFVAVDAQGRIVAPYNTDGMFRGWVSTEGDLVVATHGEEHFVERLVAG